MSTVTIPRADIAAVEQDANGRFIASRDLYRWMRDITARVGGVTALSLTDVLEEVGKAKSMAGAAFALGGEDGEGGGGVGAPGNPGVDGATGAAGPPGPGLFFIQDPIEPDFALPGPKGEQGAAGNTGATGSDGPMGGFFLLDVPEPDAPIPGARGADGAAGSAGAAGYTGPAVFFALDPEEGERGPPGPTGATGATGAAVDSAAGAFMLLGDMPDASDMIFMPVAARSDPVIGAYAPGSFNVPNGFYCVMSKTLQLTGAEYVTLAGTAQLRIT